MSGWTIPQIARAYRVDDQTMFRRYLREQGVKLPIADRQTVKRLVQAYRQSGGQ